MGLGAFLRSRSKMSGNFFKILVGYQDMKKPEKYRGYQTVGNNTPITMGTTMAEIT